MSDILYLQTKEKKGNLRNAQGSLAIDTTGDLATLTAAAGKDMYLARVKAGVSLSGTSNHEGTGTIVLKVDGNVVDAWNFALVVTAGEGTTSMGDHEFLVGFKAIAGQTIKLECTIAGDEVLTERQLRCVEENTGVSPFDEFK